MNESASPKSPLRRRRYLIDRGLQTAFVLEIWIYLAVYTLILLTVLLAPALLSAGWGSPDSKDSLQAARQFLFVGIWVLPATLILFVGLGITAIVRSNRFAGPIYRLKAITKQIGAGDLSVRVSLRERDFLQDFRDIYNETLSSLAEKIQEAQIQNRLSCEELNAAIERLRSGILPDGVSAHQIESALSHQEKLRSVLATFKT